MFDHFKGQQLYLTMSMFDHYKGQQLYLLLEAIRQLAKSGVWGRGRRYSIT